MERTQLFDLMGELKLYGAHSSDRDQSFQAMVITVSMGS